MRFSEGSSANFLAEAACVSLIEEAELSPKPGLVDCRSSGSHSDMNYNLMCRSALSLQPYFEEMARASWGRQISNDFREEIGEIGRRAEHAMLEATCGVNTHKGAIWSLGLVISACASLRMNADSNQILDCAGGIARITDRFVPYELTHGLKVKAKYRCQGAKEEAQLGFPHVRHLGLPMLRKSKQRGDGITVSRLNSLLAILSSLEDTCVLHRGGLTALRETQRRSTAVLLAGGVGSVKGEELLEDFGCWMKDSSLSPGGAADLLATSLFIQRLSNIQ